MSSAVGITTLRGDSVMGKAGKISSQGTTVMPPWFVPLAIYRKTYALLPKTYYKRFSTYFHRYGCLRCGRKNDKVLYGANGLCLPCLGLVSDRLKICDGVLERGVRSTSSGKPERFLRRVNSARRLLADLVDRIPKPSRRSGPRSRDARER
jgi:hypothetical protein